MVDGAPSTGAVIEISRWRRLVTLAAAAYLVIPFPVQAGPVVLQSVFYRIQTFGYEPASGGYAYSQESDSITTTPQINTEPRGLSVFIRKPSSFMTTAGGSYYGTATTIQGNETLAQVKGDISLSSQGTPPFIFSDQLGIGVEADTYYQVMVVNTHFVPSNVKGVPIIGTTAGTTSCSTEAGDSAVAQVVVDDIVYAKAQCPPEPGLIDTSFSTKATSTFPIGVPVNVVVSAYGTLNLGVGYDQDVDHGTFYASADPSFEIDPSFPYADDFELVYSPGLAMPPDGTDIPEPGSLLLLAVGAPLTVGLRRYSSRSRIAV